MQNAGQRVRLSHGDVTGYDEYGAADGPPVFVFHGNPGSRLDVLYAGREVLASLQGRVISLDRPGIGLSSPQPGRRLVDWPTTMNLIADALGINRYAVIGGSAGGPYALACARFNPERLTAAGVISSLGPPDGPRDIQPIGTAGLYFKLARLVPPLFRAQLWLMAKGLRNPDRMIRQSMKTMPRPDAALIAQPEGQQALLAAFGEGLRTPAGLAQDAALVARPWGFRVQDIQIPCMCGTARQTATRR